MQQYKGGGSSNEGGGGMLVLIIVVAVVVTIEWWWRWRFGRVGGNGESCRRWVAVERWWWL